MEFNSSTFILEIINFLVLIWILQRFFYKPILAVIAKRKAFIDQSIIDTQLLQQQAEKQRSLYESRQQLWEQEKQVALSALHQQINVERRLQMEKLKADLIEERTKLNVTLQHQQQAFQQQAQLQALQNGAHFASLLLKQSAGPELEARLVMLLLNNLKALPETCNLCQQMLANKKAIAIKVTSVYPLSTEQQAQLEQQLAELINSPITLQYQQEATLIAGIRLDIGAWVLNANLQHELIGFTEIANEFE
jgi:F-type H+-transporting ATPase subunit b